MLIYFMVTQNGKVILILKNAYWFFNSLETIANILKNMSLSSILQPLRLHEQFFWVDLKTYYIRITEIDSPKQWFPNPGE